MHVFQSFTQFSLLLEMAFYRGKSSSYEVAFERRGSDIHRFQRMGEVVNDFNHIGILLDYEYSLFCANVCN